MGECQVTEAARFGGDWGMRWLGDHLKFLRHGTNPRSDLTTDGSVGYLHYGDIHTSADPYLDPDVRPMPTLTIEQASLLDPLDDGDLVFVDASEDLEGVGKSVELKGLRGRPVVAGLHTIAVRFNKSVLADGFKAYLQFHPAFLRHLRRLAAGTKVYATNRTHIASAQLPLPPLSEQRAIAAVLSDMDELIRSLKALIAKKRAIKQTAMQELLTGRKRLPGFGGEWETRRLANHLKFLRHGTNPRSDLTRDGTVEYLHYGDIHVSADALLDPRERSMPTLTAERAKRLDRLVDGDVVFVDASEDLEGVGKSVELKGMRDRHFVAGLHTIAVRFSKSVLANGFKAYLQFHPTFLRHLRRLAAGTKVYATNRAHIASARLSLPPLPEQRAMATVLSDMEAEISALVQQLLTGSIRLPISATSVEGEADP